MSKSVEEQKLWEYPSLEWLHRVRERHFEEEKGKPLSQIKPQLSAPAAQVARRLKLKKVHATELSRRRRAG